MQITIENWKKKTGADLVYVPVRGGGDMVTALLTGTTPVAIVGLPNFIPYIRDGTVKALAVDSEDALGVVSRCADFAGAGLSQSGAGLFRLRRSCRHPKPIVERLHDDIAAIGNEPDFRKARLIDIGIVPVFDTPEHLAQYLKSNAPTAPSCSGSPDFSRDSSREYPLLDLRSPLRGGERTLPSVDFWEPLARRRI